MSVRIVSGSNHTETRFQRHSAQRASVVLALALLLGLVAIDMVRSQPKKTQSEIHFPLSDISGRVCITLALGRVDGLSHSRSAWKVT